MPVSSKQARKQAIYDAKRALGIGQRPNVAPTAMPVVPYDESALQEWDALPKLPVSSSNVAKIAYNRDTGRCFVEFLPSGNRGFSLYYYDDFGDSAWESFVHAPSYGKHVYHVIRNEGSDNRYVCKQVY